ncbi:MAG: hypothetical protein H6766_04875 [Candidatus Peribacteria bacterium]|nr:MAG: hypothetical protein H6766_04875 [Candidatus Peribacteria bacterium]
MTVGTQWFFDQQSNTSIRTQAQCPEAYNTSKYYLAGDLDNDGIPDLGQVRYLKDNFQYASVGPNTYRLALLTARFGDYVGTQVGYYQPESNMLGIYANSQFYSLVNQRGWYRASKVAPLDQWVRAVTSEPFLLEAPISNNGSNDMMQITYDVRFAGFRNYNTNATSTYQALILPNANDFDSTTAANSRWLKQNPSNPSGLGPVRNSDYINQ